MYAFVVKSVVGVSNAKRNPKVLEYFNIERNFDIIMYWRFLQAGECDQFPAVVKGVGRRISYKISILALHALLLLGDVLGVWVELIC